jgi:hypothetical protein
MIGGPIGAAVAVAEVTGARAAALSRVQAAVIKAGKPVGKAVTRGGPVWAALRQRHDGTEDKDSDIRTLALKRIDDIARQAVQAPDATFTAVQPLIGTNPDAAAAIQQQALKIINLLAANMPKDPGTVQTMLKSGWKPTTEQATKLAEMMYAAYRPLDALDALMEGKAGIVAADTLHEMYPALMQKAAQDFMVALPSLGKIAHNRLAALSVAFRMPLDGLLTKENIAYFQGPDVHGRTMMAEPVYPKQPDLTSGPKSSGMGAPSSRVQESQKTQVQSLTR